MNFKVLTLSRLAKHIWFLLLFLYILRPTFGYNLLFVHGGQEVYLDLYSHFISWLTARVSVCDLFLFLLGHYSRREAAEV